LALIPALWAATELDGIRGAAFAQTGIGLLVAVPLAALALRRARVDLAPIGPALVRPLLAAGLAAAVTIAVARFAGPQPLVQLLLAGTAGVAVYVPAAVPRDQLRQWRAMLRRGGPATALD
jgi:PST family polysaccharide transporter